MAEKNIKKVTLFHLTIYNYLIIYLGVPMIQLDTKKRHFRLFRGMSFFVIYP